MKQKLNDEQLKTVSGGAAESRYEIGREVYYHGEDRCHGHYVIHYSDGSFEWVEF